MTASDPPLAAVASVVPSDDTQPADAVVVRCLSFRFPMAAEATIQDLSLTLPRGSRCLLTGANGAGAVLRGAGRTPCELG